MFASGVTGLMTLSRSAGLIRIPRPNLYAFNSPRAIIRRNVFSDDLVSDAASLSVSVSDTIAPQKEHRVHKNDSVCRLSVLGVSGTLSKPPGPRLRHIVREAVLLGLAPR